MKKPSPSPRAQAAAKEINDHEGLEILSEPQLAKIIDRHWNPIREIEHRILEDSTKPEPVKAREWPNALLAPSGSTIALKFLRETSAYADWAEIHVKEVTANESALLEEAKRLIKLFSYVADPFDKADAGQWLSNFPEHAPEPVQPDENGWLPISNRPHDTYDVLIYDEDAGQHQGCYDGSTWLAKGEGHSVYPLTKPRYWKELTPPTPTKQP